MKPREPTTDSERLDAILRQVRRSPEVFGQVFCAILFGVPLAMLLWEFLNIWIFHQYLQNRFPPP